MKNIPIPLSDAGLHRWAVQERIVFVFIVLVFVFLLVPALRHAHMSFRDEERIRDLGVVKQSLEQHYNKHNSYLVTNADQPLQCAFSDGASSDPVWGTESVLPRDGAFPKEQRFFHFPYLYCPTILHTMDGKPVVDGFFLQAALEEQRPLAAGFDFEEGRNFRFRVLHDGRRTFYRICGGSDVSCGPLTSP